MTSVETSLLRIEQDALATERARLAAAEDVFAIFNAELDEHLATWNHFSTWVDELGAQKESAR